ncbi:MAG: hypothetical protein KME27_10570 [Lyngbya sp. HA4199-MV5]|jgi:hypothetical protein|nr:hypothetical protein [Lyngbya sp. HA4199-MV5]
MSNQYISFTLGDLSLTIYDYQFAGDAFPRLIVEQPASQRSAYGNFVGYGRVYEAPHILVFSAFLEWDEWKLLDGLYRRQEKRRQAREPVANVETLVVDTTTEFQEEGSRTRALAPAPFNTVSNISATEISYFAQYYFRFTQPPKFNRKGARVEAVVALEESDRKVAP